MRISDWSSYVCSSDLLLTKKFSGKRWPGHLINHYSHRPMFVPPPENDPDQRCPWTLSTSNAGRSLPCHRRSAERRVGQECVKTCRSGWSASHSKKKADTIDTQTQRKNKKKT